VLISFLDKAHQTSARYLKSESEFKKTGLTEHYLNDFHAPFVKESSVKFAMNLHSCIPIEANNTILVVGEVKEIHLPEELISEDGNIKHFNADSAGIIGLDSYITPQKLFQYSYAKPEKYLIKKPL
jgi:flavin reductase (DIM6/NTAB) family NADH-FMN oxidoreductase RutF